MFSPANIFSSPLIVVILFMQGQLIQSIVPEKYPLLVIIVIVVKSHAYILESTVSLSPNTYATASLLFLQDSSLMPVARPKIITFATASPWYCNNMLLTAQQSSDSKIYSAFCNALELSLSVSRGQCSFPSILLLILSDYCV